MDVGVGLCAQVVASMTNGKGEGDPDFWIRFAFAVHHYYFFILFSLIFVCYMVTTVVVVVKELLNRFLEYQHALSP